ncbi:hypothetical protein GCM10011503_03700 [Henriciella pelagia]|uniref:Uncharacterized protein n=1 Tax=Henriciella pelagia TaxID=1977912 RepID=A0ABQ1J6F3_9PROT|nr:hypothetical protein GCM10011503_03700 [Henriciella pelagia]
MDADLIKIEGGRFQGYEGESDGSSIGDSCDVETMGSYRLLHDMLGYVIFKGLAAKKAGGGEQLSGGQINFNQAGDIRGAGRSNRNIRNWLAPEIIA